MPPQLEKNHVVPTAWQDEALARDGVSREVPCSALKARRSLTAFLRPPKVPRHAGFPRGSYTQNDATYAIQQVFGGGNQADYNPTSTSSRATVHVYTCLNTIGRVFGGGNAAAAYGVVTTIDGGRFNYIFGGGNGESSAANIGAGGTNLTVPDRPRRARRHFDRASLREGVRIAARPH